MACLSKSSVVMNSLLSLEIKDVNESGAFWCRASWKHFQWVSHLEPIHILMLLYHIVSASLAILQLEEGHQTISWCCYLLQFSQWRAWPGVTNTLKTIHQAWNEHKLVTLHIPIPPMWMYKIYSSPEEWFPVPGVPESQAFGKYNAQVFQDLR